jgi:hypothetical protein
MCVVIISYMLSQALPASSMTMTKKMASERHKATLCHRPRLGRLAGAGSSEGGVVASAVADKSAAVVVCAAWAAGAAGVGMGEVGSVMAGLSGKAEPPDPKKSQNTEQKSIAACAF